MPSYRYRGNRFSTVVENLLLGTHFTEMHSGMKAYSRHFLDWSPSKSYSDDFVFDTEILVAAVVGGFRIQEVAIPTRYTGSRRRSMCAAPWIHPAERRSLLAGLWGPAGNVGGRLRPRRTELGHHTGVRSLERSNQISFVASRRSVVTRSPGGTGISEGATTVSLQAWSCQRVHFQSLHQPADRGRLVGHPAELLDLVGAVRHRRHDPLPMDIESDIPRTLRPGAGLR